jgi:hypothetical protein
MQRLQSCLSLCACAVVGGLIGAVAGGNRSVERSAGVGAILGGSKGAGATERERAGS